MEEDMKKLDFVNWDRFSVNEENGTVDLYGWIPRKDTHEDFVLLIYTSKHNTWDTKFSTSSKEKTKEIFKALRCDEQHSNCKRVENVFAIKNCIHLSNE